MSVLGSRHIVLHRQQTWSVVTRLNGTIIVYRTTNTSRTTQYGTFKDIGYRLAVVGTGT